MDQFNKIKTWFWVLKNLIFLDRSKLIVLLVDSNWIKIGETLKSSEGVEVQKFIYGFYIIQD